ncbi:MAG: hypothetical protein H0X72_07315 [Acidobacteria bacterium]|jgi:hypothetical protein|nr:hypothetical protein [Acidobacteriota bacterium]
MKSAKLFIFLVALAAFSACATSTTNTNANTNNNANLTNTANVNTKPTAQNLTEVPRPQKIQDEMTTRGEQDNAAPTITVVEPKNGATVNSSVVKVKLTLAGDLKGYKPTKDMTTGMGNHIHVILDNQPYEAYYNLDQEFELRNVSDGEHTLRFFPSRPWHESYKNANAFQMVKFTVRNGGADTTKPATTNANQAMSNANTSATPEGKDMQSSTAGAIDAAKPLLTYSRPKGEYKGADAEAIMIDFWLSGNQPVLQNDDPNGQLVAIGSPFRVRYSVDGGEAKFIDKWQAIWLSGWTEGKHTIKLELVDKDGNLVDNGGYNSTTREITVTK